MAEGKETEFVKLNHETILLMDYFKHHHNSLSDLFLKIDIEEESWDKNYNFFIQQKREAEKFVKFLEPELCNNLTEQIIINLLATFTNGMSSEFYEELQNFIEKNKDFR